MPSEAIDTILQFSATAPSPHTGIGMQHITGAASLEDIQVEARVQMYPPGNSRRTIRPDLVRAMRPQVLDMGLASATELDELDTAARAHLQDPHTIVISGLLFLTWGRKPDHIQHEFPLASQAAPDTIHPDTG